jgi:YD repeat-containing protein
MGYSGNFHLWYNGKEKVYNTNFNANELKIKFSGDYGISTIEIQTGNGYSYYFGGNEERLEYTETDVYGSSVKERTYHTWKLYTITAPNGRTVTFDYNRPYSDYSKFINNYNPISTYTRKVYDTYDEKQEGTSTTKMYTYPLTKIIITDGVEINFNYEKTTGEKKLDYLNNKADSSEYVKSPKLNNITVKNIENKVIKKCNVLYKKNKKTNDNYRTTNIVYFLGQLNISGEGIYDFEYNDRAAKGFPILGTFSIDHWGYYNGKNDDGNIFDFRDYLEYNVNNLNENIINNLREPDHSCTKRGMLQRITYPTGGYSILEYEPHDYSKYIRRTIETFYEPAISDNDNVKEQTGGLRIKKNTTYSQEHTILSTKNYVYETSAGISSGIRLNFPRYGIKYNTNYGYVEYYSLYDYFKYNGTHIEYSKVTEINSDNSKIEYNYTNSDSDNDNFIDMIMYSYYQQMSCLIKHCNNQNYQFLISGYHIALVLNILTPIVSKQPFRGKLTSKNFISNTGTIIRSEMTNYNYKTIHEYDAGTLVGEYGLNVANKDLNTTLQSNTTTNYFGSSEVNENTTYTYNPHGQIATTTTTDSKGDKIVTKYKYVTDITNPTGIYKAMIDNNVINDPIEDSTYTIKANTTAKILLSWRKYNYYQPNTAQAALIRIQYIQEYDTQSQEFIITANYVHDKKGRVLQKTDINGIATTYLWGYNGLYPVAKIDNCKLSQVKNISGLGNIETVPITGGISTYETSLRNISGAEVTTFDYFPFVGLKKMTDPTGKVTMYDYNTTGKLKSIVDDLSNLRNKYYYSTDDKN